MRKLVFILLLALSHLGLAQKKGNLHKDIGEASVQVVRDKDGVSGYSTVETTYRVQYAQLPSREHQEYLAKLRTNTTVTRGMEGKDRTIEFALSPLGQPSLVALTAKHACDEIEFLNDHYRTTKNGCCLDLDKIKLFDYHNKEIIAGSGGVTTVTVPNNEVKFYFAFSDIDSRPKSLGKITISYGSGRRYDIHLLSDKVLGDSVELIDGKPFHVETCPYKNPELALLSGGKEITERDSYTGAYQLLSMEGIKSTSELRDIAIQVSFTCDKSIKPFLIPIINGFPFGKNQWEHTYNIMVN
ncbi:hypothetical protein [Rufibacter radiotolerans]|nr:hypothetical protein [Rufibacter radiotolerans]